ncbi:hypothetical protein GCM10011583_52060 [Streptomyces camponoticapitis]|uniref:Uncharacterized protein n=1 Tax=Streptomyces camponoticapitis TaxID=1616125 RepID=A0ABQ2EJC5_9ACTN|nr:hypothetical protein GCM10011583_52060 [Streptomyces camponoticapitis]
MVGVVARDGIGQDTQPVVLAVDDRIDRDLRPGVGGDLVPQVLPVVAGGDFKDQTEDGRVDPARAGVTAPPP